MTGRRSLVGAAVLTAAWLFLSANPAMAEKRVSNKWLDVAVEDIEKVWPKLKPVQKILAIKSLIEIGSFDRADRLLERTVFRGGAASDANFLRGQLHAARGEYTKAVDVFRAILTNHPKHEMARLELAHALFALKQDSAARHHFNLSLGAISDPHLKSKVHNFIDAMDRRKRWNFSTYLSAVPSTNINQGAVPSFPSSHHPTAPSTRKVPTNVNPRPAYFAYWACA